jgi:hypothetical protein
MSGALIFLGLFLWFAIAFNGGIGEPFVNYLAIASGLFMVVTGIMIIKKYTVSSIRIISMLAIITYSAVIWQRFNFSYGIDWGGIVFDCIYVVLLLWVIIRCKPNKSFV